MKKKIGKIIGNKFLMKKNSFVVWQIFRELENCIYLDVFKSGFNEGEALKMNEEKVIIKLSDCKFYCSDMDSPNYGNLFVSFSTVYDMVTKLHMNETSREAILEFLENVKNETIKNKQKVD